MLFYLLSTLGFLMLLSTVFIVGICYYFLVQNMLQKSKRASQELKRISQSKLLQFNQKSTTKHTENIYCVRSLS